MYIKSPLNYTGGKFKLLPQILPLLPKEINNFVDLFCGGCNVAVNVEISGNKYCNDIESHVIDFYKGVQGLTGEEAKLKVLEVVEKYGLSKQNQDGFLKCREDYNKEKTWEMFYAVISHAFNYQIRYNKNGDYNMPFGKDRSSFSEVLQKKFVDFVDELHNKNTYIFTNKDFREVDFDNLGDNAFVYADPPYLITNAAYNENGGWTEKDENDLYALLDKLNEKGIKFMLSNVIENKGKTNEILQEWSKKYTVIDLNHSYGNCSYHAKDKGKDTTREVVVVNYQPDLTLK